VPKTVHSVFLLVAVCSIAALLCFAVFKVLAACMVSRSMLDFDRCKARAMKNSKRVNCADFVLKSWRNSPHEYIDVAYPKDC
jgi:hypothetical protein